MHICHPDRPDQPSTVSDAAFSKVWAAKGFVPCEVDVIGRVTELHEAASTEQADEVPAPETTKVSTGEATTTKTRSRSGGKSKTQE